MYSDVEDEIEAVNLWVSQGMKNQYMNEEPMYESISEEPINEEPIYESISEEPIYEWTNIWMNKYMNEPIY